MLLSMLVLAPLFSGPNRAKNPEEWKAAAVVYSHHEFRNDGNDVADTGMIQTAHERFDLDAGNVTYTVEQ